MGVLSWANPENFGPEALVWDFNAINGGLEVLLH